MISKNDIILLLTDMQQNGGIDIAEDLSEVYRSPGVPFEILRKINEYRQLDVTRFYEKLRKSYNHKRSKLYINIVKADDNAIKDPQITLTTLSALLNQILQFDAEDKEMFYSHSRADEIIKVLDVYFRTFSMEPAYKLLHLIRIDLKALEEIDRKNR